jgi:Glycosyl hydrolases family 35
LLVQSAAVLILNEPERGKYDFTGNKNLRLFIQKAKDAGLYVILRVGPYVCAEWNYGGFPAWLREIGGIDHRGFNPAFMNEMTVFVTEICSRLA